jgi:Caspase domain
MLVISLPMFTGAVWAAANSGGERRIALIVGNNEYRYVTGLNNAVADARAMKRELEERGFQVVYRENATRHTMNDAIEEFLGRLSTDAVGVVYFSGHGVQINSANFLIPTDLQAEKEADVANDGIDLGKLLDRMAQVQAVRQRPRRRLHSRFDAGRNDRVAAPAPHASARIAGDRSYDQPRRRRRIAARTARSVADLAVAVDFAVARRGAGRASVGFAPAMEPARRARAGYLKAAGSAAGRPRRPGCLPLGSAASLPV